MRTHVFAPLLACAALAGCATTAPVPAGLMAGKFVSFDCEGQDFQARFNAEGNTVRVRSHSGAAELSPTGDGVYEAEGFKLTMKGASGVTLEAAGKVLGRNCKRA
jgi:hypothetical protein